MEVVAKYTCKQVELYSVATIVLNSFNENKAAFEAFKGKYADPYGANLQGLLDAALDLPGFQMRDMRSEEAGILMRELARKNLDNFQALKRYIRDVAAWQNTQKPKLEAAGSLEYPKAAKYNWEYVLILINSMRLFLDDFAAELQADDNMPASFLASYNTDAEDYLNLYNELMDAEQDNEQETQAKVQANNELFVELTRMMEDGQFVFRDDPALRKRFIFGRVLNRIQRPGGGSTPPPEPEEGIGSVSGTVTRSDNGMPLSGAEVTIAALGMVVVSDINGTYSMPEVPSGNHTVMGWHELMESLEKEVTVMAEANVVVDFNLQPLEE